MVISRTPFRISFFGGGTDYHTWYQEHGAAVVATTINHYCYLHCRVKPPFFTDHQTRIVWKKIEEVFDHNDIQHPSVRAVLEYLDIREGIEVHHIADLPARSGLGSSSAFTVGMLNAMYALRGAISSKRELACEAIHIERAMLKENVGVQDQIETAYGGLNKIVVQTDGDFAVYPLVLPAGRAKQLESHLVLFFTGISRAASDIAADKIKSIPNKQKELTQMRAMVDQAINVLASRNEDITDFGKLLHETWMCKRSIAASISTEFVDDVYERARKAGATGGKLLGAGGGGFMLFYVTAENRARVIEALKDLLLIPFQFENSGSQIIFYDNHNYNAMELARRDYRHLQSGSADDTNASPPNNERLNTVQRVES